MKIMFLIYIQLSSILQGHRNVTNLGGDKLRGRQNCRRIVLKNCRKNYRRRLCWMVPYAQTAGSDTIFMVRSGYVICCRHCHRLIRLGLINVPKLVGTSPNVPIRSNGPDLGIFLTVEIEQCKWHLCIYQSTYHLPMNVTQNNACRIYNIVDTYYIAYIQES